MNVIYDRICIIFLSRKYQPSEEYTLYPGFMMGLSVLLNPHEEKEKISYRLTNGMEVGFPVLYVGNLL